MTVIENGQIKPEGIEVTQLDAIRIVAPHVEVCKALFDDEIYKKYEQYLNDGSIEAIPRLDREGKNPKWVIWGYEDAMREVFAQLIPQNTE